MQPNPFSSLLRSKKFWLATFDAVISTVLLLAARFLAPADVELVKQIIVIYQPVIIAVILGIAAEDMAVKSATIHAAGMVDAAAISPVPPVPPVPPVSR